MATAARGGLAGLDHFHLSKNHPQVLGHLLYKALPPPPSIEVNVYPPGL